MTRIGFDLDGVLCDQNIALLLKKLGNASYYETRKPLLDPKSVTAPNDELYIITSRPTNIIKITQEWCAKNLPAMKLFFASVQMWKNAFQIFQWYIDVAAAKAKIINENKIEVYYEDIPEVVAQLRQLCPLTKIIHYGGNGN